LSNYFDLLFCEHIGLFTNRNHIHPFNWYHRSTGRPFHVTAAEITKSKYMKIKITTNLFDIRKALECAAQKAKVVT